MAKRQRLSKEQLDYLNDEDNFRLGLGFDKDVDETYSFQTSFDSLQKSMRASFTREYLLWSKKLTVPPAIKNQRKFELKLTKEQFEAFETQLFWVGSVWTKKERSPFMPLKEVVTLSPKVYKFYFEVMHGAQICKLVIWSYFNKFVDTPSSELESIFDRDKMVFDHLLGDPSFPVDNRQSNKHSFTIETFTKRSLTWSFTEREAAVNTRNFVFQPYNYYVPEKEVMISKLPFKNHDSFFKSFFSICMSALQKAEVEEKERIHRNICKICCIQLGVNFDVMAQSCDLKLVSFSKLMEKKKLLMEPLKRQSITDFSVDPMELKAATIIQRTFRSHLDNLHRNIRQRRFRNLWLRIFYRHLFERAKKRVKRVKQIVLQIEDVEWPRIVETIEVRRSVYVNGCIQSNKLEESMFDYESYEEEIKTDYVKNVKNPPKQHIFFWVKCVLFLLVFVIPLSVIDVSFKSDETAEVLTFVVIAVFQTFTYVKQYVWFKSFQTAMLLVGTILLLRTYCKHSEYYLLFAVVAVPILRRYWMLGLLGNAAFAFLPWLTYANQGTMISISIFNIYVLVTTVASSGSDSVIDFFHKIVTNYTAGVVFFLYAVCACIGCVAPLHAANTDLPF